MTVRRIVANLPPDGTGKAAAFYRDLLGLDVLMDLGWITTFGASDPAPVQVSVATEGGSGTPVPHLSIEVDDVETLHARAQELGFAITYPLTTEPWGVRRFYVRDPMGNEINIVTHTD
jgi:catechol 2,3-dioxygenase-like lactoylglutathione lyase family enzyme